MPSYCFAILTGWLSRYHRACPSTSLDKSRGHAFVHPLFSCQVLERSYHVEEEEAIGKFACRKETVAFTFRYIPLF